MSYDNKNHEEAVDLFLETLSATNLGIAKKDEVLSVLKDVFRFTPFQIERELKPFVSQPIDLDQLVSEVKDIALERHPALIETAESLVKADALMQFLSHYRSTGADWPKTMRKAIVFAAVFDRLNVKIGEDAQFHSFVYSYLESEFKKKMNFSSFVRILRTFGPAPVLFMFLKRWSMNELITMYQNIREHKKITFLQRVKRRVGLFINICEATFLDFVKGSKPNALSGVTLALDSFESLEYDPASTKVLYKFTRGYDWVRLYTIWNLAFVQKNFFYTFDKMGSKLLIPSVLGADHKEYIFHRCTALHLMAEVEFLRILDLKEKANFKRPQEIDNIANIMATISQIYALKYRKNLPLLEEAPPEKPQDFKAVS